MSAEQSVYEKVLFLTKDLPMHDRLALNAAIITYYDAIRGRFGEAVKEATVKLGGTVAAATIQSWNVPG